MNFPISSSPSNSNNNDTTSSSASTHTLSEGVFPTVIRKPFPKACLIQEDAARRQKTFVGLTSKRFCVTTPANPGHALSLLRFPPDHVGGFDVIFVDLDGFGGGTNSNDGATSFFSSPSTSRSNSPSGNRRRVKNITDNDEGTKNNNEEDSSMSSFYGSSTMSKMNKITGLQFVQSTRMKEHAVMQSLTSSALREQNTSENNSSASLLVTQKSSSSSSQLHANNKFAQHQKEKIDNDPRLQHLIGMTLEERRLRKERELELMESKVLSASKKRMLRHDEEDVVEDTVDYTHSDVKRKLELQHTLDLQSKQTIETVRTNRGADTFGQKSLVVTSPATFSSRSGASVRTVTYFKDEAQEENQTVAMSKVNDSVIGNDFITNTFKNMNHNDMQMSSLISKGSGGGGGASSSQPDPISLRGASSAKLLFQQHRHIIVGLCTSVPDRERYSDLVMNMKTTLIQPYGKVQPADRDDCYPLFDAVIRYPFKSHLDRLESIFVAKEESLAQFAETPNVKQLNALLTDLSERRVGGMLRICDAPDWRKLTRALASNSIEQTLTLLQPIPKIYKVAKDDTGVSTHRTNVAVDDGHGIPQAATNALVRAQTDVHRTRERLDLEREAVVAVNDELEKSHDRNRELTRRIEESLEEQRKLEEKVDFLTSQLARKVLEAKSLRETTDDAIKQAQEANFQYEALCSSKARFDMEKQYMIEAYEGEIARLRQIAGRRAGKPRSFSPGASSNIQNRSVSYSNVGGTAVPIKSTQKRNNNNEKSFNPLSSGSKSFETNSNESSGVLMMNTSKSQSGTLMMNASNRSSSAHHQSLSMSATTGGGGGGGGGAFRSFNPSQYSNQKQDARCVEVDIGIEAPVYLDLLTESRTKCLDYMYENNQLREELFDAQSKIFKLVNAHVEKLEELGLIKFNLNQHAAATTNSSSTPPPTGSLQPLASRYNLNTTRNNNTINMKSHDLFFASFRRKHQQQQSNDQQPGISRSSSLALVSQTSSASFQQQQQQHVPQPPPVSTNAALVQQFSTSITNEDNNNKNNDGIVDTFATSSSTGGGSAAAAGASQSAPGFSQTRMFDSIASGGGVMPKPYCSSNQQKQEETKTGSLSEDTFGSTTAFDAALSASARAPTAKGSRKHPPSTTTNHHQPKETSSSISSSQNNNNNNFFSSVTDHMMTSSNDNTNIRNLVKTINKKWQSRLERQSANYEKHLMEAHDLVSSFTIEENVFNLVRTGTRFNKNSIASVDFDKLREVRARAEFADDSVQGALSTEAHAVITNAHLGKAPRNATEALDQADVELKELEKQFLVGGTTVVNDNKQVEGGSSSTKRRQRRKSLSTDATSGSESDGGGGASSASSRPRSGSSGAGGASVLGRSTTRKRRKSTSQQQNLSLKKKLRNAAINIANKQGSGGAAAAVITSMIETAQNKSREPIRSFLRKRLETMWNSVKGLTQTTMLDVMTTHSALSGGLERLLSGSGIPPLPAAASSSFSTNRQFQQQPQTGAGGFSPTPPLSQTPQKPSTPRSASIFVPQQQQLSRTSSSASLGIETPGMSSFIGNPFGGSINNNNQQSPRSYHLNQNLSQNQNQQQQQQQQTVLMKREKQQQLAMTLRKMFLDRIVNALNKLSDNLAETFSRNVYETYLGAIEVMEEEIHKAVQPVALENSRLATSLLMAKTAAHNQIGLEIQRQRERLRAEQKQEDQNQQQQQSKKKQNHQNKETSGVLQQQQDAPSGSNTTLLSLLTTTATGEIKLPDYFGKEVNTRDGWSQTRPILMRDVLEVV